MAGLLTKIFSALAILPLAAGYFATRRWLETEEELFYVVDIGQAERIGVTWIPVANHSEHANKCKEILFNQAVTTARLRLDYLPNNTLAAVADYLRLIGRPTIYSAGLFFNVLTICILLRRELRMVATCNIMIAMAIADCFTLMNGYFYWVEYELLRPSMTASMSACKLAVFTVYCGPEMSACMLMMMSVERLLRQIDTPRHEVWFSIKKTRIYILVTAVFIIILNVPIPTFDIFFRECDQQICWNIYHDSPEILLLHDEHSGGIANYYGVYKWIALVIYWIVPFFGLPVINTWLLCSIWKANRGDRMEFERSEIPAPWQLEHPLPEDGVQENNITRMFIVVTVAYWLMTTGFNFIQADIIKIYSGTTDGARAMYSLWYSIFLLLFYLNHGSSFFLYFLSARPYREELKAMWQDLKAFIYIKILRYRMELHETKESVHLRSSASSEYSNSITYGPL